MAISVVQAGRLGGLEVRRRKGLGFFSEIGKKGQAAMRQKYPGMACEWGKKGGRPKKLALVQIMGQEGKDEKGG